MIEKYQEEKLELINKERIDLENSKEYILGRKIFKIKNILKNKKIPYIVPFAKMRNIMWYFCVLTNR